MKNSVVHTFIDSHSHIRIIIVHLYIDWAFIRALRKTCVCVCVCMQPSLTHRMHDVNPLQLSPRSTSTFIRPRESVYKYINLKIIGKRTPFPAPPPTPQNKPKRF